MLILILWEYYTSSYLIRQQISESREIKKKKKKKDNVLFAIMISTIWSYMIKHMRFNQHWAK